MTPAVNILSHIVECAVQVHLCVAKRVVRYLAGTMYHGIMIGNGRGDENGQARGASELYGYSDSH